MNGKVEALPIACSIYEHDWSDYPDKVRVSMSDGKVVDYRIDVKQPSPVFREQLDRFSKICIGYQPKRMRRKKHEGD